MKNLEKERAVLGSSDSRYLDWFDLDSEKLDALIQTERERAKAIDEKAAKVTTVLAIGLTIGSTFAKSISDTVSIPILKTIVQLGLFIAMLYIVAGGLIGLMSGSLPKPQGGYGPDWEVDLVRAKRAPKRPRIDVLVEFEITNLIRNNDVSTALLCVRNGAIAFSIVVLLAEADPLFGTLVDAVRPLMLAL